jgi:hypothetical protein
VLKTPERRVFGSPGVSTASRRPALPQNPSDGAISNFFHALLNKKSGQAALNLGGGSAPNPSGDNSQESRREMVDFVLQESKCRLDIMSR